MQAEEEAERENKGKNKKVDEAEGTGRRKGSNVIGRMRKKINPSKDMR